MHLKKITTVTKINKIPKRIIRMLPTNLKRGEESELMRNEALHWFEQVYQNLPLAT